jgi:hypothetical protein
MSFQSFDDLSPKWLLIKMYLKEFLNDLEKKELNNQND